MHRPAGALSAGLVLAFAGLGASAAGVPASLPAMAATLAVPTTDILGAVPLLFGGLLAGVLGSPFLARRLTLPQVVALGAATQAAGLALAGTASTATDLLWAAALVGLGFGAVESSGAVLARSPAPRRATGPLTGLMACVAGVAALTPVLIVTLGTGGTRIALVLLATPHLVAVPLLLQVRSPQVRRPRRSEPRLRPSQLRPVVWLAATIFFYVGTESLLAGWSADFVERALALDPDDAALGTSAFWILLTVGRLSGWTLLRRGVEAHALLTGCLAVASTSLITATALLPTAPAPAAVATGLAIIAFGPCYAQILGIGVALAPSSASADTSAALIATGALGGALLAGLGVLAVTSLDLGPTAVPAVATVLATLTAFRGSSPAP